MNYFKIFAHGDDFDVDAYATTATIGFDRVRHKGEQHYTTNGIEKLLGDGQQLSCHDQDRIATHFLEEHESELTTLAKVPGVDTFILQLQYRTDVKPILRGFWMSFSARLMYFALKAGVDPMFFVDLGRPDGRDRFRA